MSKESTPSMVSSLAMAFRKATSVPEDVAEAKKEHRNNLRTLTDKYMREVAEGKVEGIRNAKELVEVIKADLLLMGEATERNDNTPDEIRMSKITQALDPNSPEVKALEEQLFARMNTINDEEDTSG